MMLGHDDGNHALCDPNTCFAAKCAYWRNQGSPPLQFTYGRNQFHGPTNRERLHQARTEFKARNGYEAEPAQPGDY